MLGIRVPSRPKTRTLLLAAAATGLVVALIPVGGTYALWNDVETVSPGTITSGSMTLTVDTPTLNASAWSNLLPGQSAAQAFSVTSTGTVAASLAASVAVTAPAPLIASHMILRLTPVATSAACRPGLAGGVTAPLTGFSSVVAADLPANSTSVLCAEVLLNAGAPIDVQGQTAAFGITLTATQK
ncbi:TasA family protein [Salinibacterium sp. ZJ454]|uniref:TasA family protein n=1 Tax=Salinibacterium sp. ZJ454 TaxID=2708339 RepID=UPI00141F13E2|nr:TasA family protein [Salinibacterium sp. ZJ454]